MNTYKVLLLVAFIGGTASLTVGGQCANGLANIHNMFVSRSSLTCSDLFSSVTTMLGTLNSCGSASPKGIVLQMRNIFDDFSRLRCIADSGALAANPCVAKTAGCFASLFGGSSRITCGSSNQNLKSTITCLNNASGCKHTRKIAAVLQASAGLIC